MHLIAPLASGMNGAPNGSVRIQKRGTSNLANYYTNFEAEGGAVALQGDLPLDGNGRVLVYVNDMVDCVVKDSGGATVVEFVAGSDAAGIEVISQSFTGTSYDDGSRAASLPTSLQLVVDSLLTSFGAADFNVLFNGASTAVQVALATLATASYFNVKSAAYGAKGDGGTDDTTAVTNAITAANIAGGGIVYFPRGTFRITGILTIPDKVSLMGAGPAASVIKLDTAATGAIQKTAGGTDWFIWSLGFDFGQANTGTVITQAVQGLLSIVSCDFGLVFNGFLQGKGIDISSALGSLVCVGCNFALGGTGGACRAISVSAAAPTMLVGCRFACTGVAYNAQFISCVGNLMMSGCTVDPTARTGAGGLSAVSPGATFACVGCTFKNAGGTAVMTDFVFGADAKGYFEAGNSFGSGVARGTPVITPSATTHEGYGSQRRDKGRYAVATDAAAITVPAASFGSAEVVRSTNAIQTINFDTPPGPGQHFTLVFNNIAVGGVSGTITMGTGGIKGLVSFTVNANKWSAYHFRSVAVGANLYWSLVGNDLNES